MELVSNPSMGYRSEAEIDTFTHQDCDDYLNYHTEEELNNMNLLEKRTLIKQLEYNFQNQ